MGKVRKCDNERGSENSLRNTGKEDQEVSIKLNREGRKVERISGLSLVQKENKGWNITSKKG